MIDIKSSNPCADCEHYYPFYVMQFDHVRGQKLFNLWRAGDSIYSLEKIQAEIDKCDLVCANCHATRTYKRNIRNNDELQNDPIDPPSIW